MNFRGFTISKLPKLIGTSKHLLWFQTIQYNGVALIILEGE